MAKSAGPLFRGKFARRSGQLRSTQSWSKSVFARRCAHIAVALGGFAVPKSYACSTRAGPAGVPTLRSDHAPKSVSSWTSLPQVRSVAAKFDRIRPDVLKFGVWLSPATDCRFGNRAKCGPNSVHFGISWRKFYQVWPAFGQSLVISGDLGPIPGSIGLHLQNLHKLPSATLIDQCSMHFLISLTMLFLMSRRPPVPNHSGGPRDRKACGYDAFICWTRSC